MFGQSYGVFKLTTGAFRLVARVCGASQETADKVGLTAGTYVGGWTALITADPVGGAGIATDVANQMDKGLNGPNKN